MAHPNEKTLTNKTKNPAHRPIFEHELRSLLRQRQWSRITWYRLVLAFDHNRPLFNLLHENDLRLARGCWRNPFHAALARLHQLLQKKQDPADLPLRHRQALVQLDQPLALARLALEEANTRAWRQLDLGPLEELVKWLGKAPLGRGAEAEELFVRALTYHALYLPREGNMLEAVKALHAMILASPAFPPSHELVFPQLLAIALGWAPWDGEGRQEVNRALIGAEFWLLLHGKKTGTAAELPELRGELALVRGAVHGSWGEHLQAEACYREALGALPATADPFLRLLLLQEAAGALVQAALAPLEFSGAAVAQTLTAGSHQQTDALARRILQTLDAEEDRFHGAKLWLELAAPLLARYGHSEQKIRQRWLGALTRQATEPELALFELIAAFEQAHHCGRRLWLPAMATDLVVLLPRMRSLEENRCREVLQHLHPILRWLVNAIEAAPSAQAPAAASPTLEPKSLG